ncbi:MAG: flagellar type III secretion system pore protein FliP [Pontiellaceae bacterium]|nr:flagellar type III secretion system pore protein FliP [Pontiellaceae bacterium]MBN2784094.1 flagellar type III secretion system pore protein FliP [Pontiellaceae bacterium]
MRKWTWIILLFVLGGTLAAFGQQTSSVMGPGINIQIGTPGEEPEGLSQAIRIVMLLTVLSLAPSFVIMTTSFTRILVVFGFLRRALGTQSAPPSQVLAGLSLFLTIFIMLPVWKQINEQAIVPYQAKEITAEQAWEAGFGPLREFMARQTGETEFALFVELSGEEAVEMDQAELNILVPAFVLSELKTSFKLGFLIYLPFLLIDLVSATVLMSLGMMMLPPMMISLPIKILFFVLADGWTVLVRGLLASFMR